MGVVMTFAKQTDRVLARLQDGPLTQYQAFEELGVWRLGARIHDLKCAGYLIQSKRVKVRNRFNESCTVAEYQLMQGLSNEQPNL